MTYHVGQPVTFRGDRYLVKHVDGEWLGIEDEEGFTIHVSRSLVQTRPYIRPVGDDAHRCYMCRRDLSDGLGSVRVDYGLHVERVCDICMEKADEGIDIPLDMTEDE
jgi:hypothetical protein